LNNQQGSGIDFFLFLILVECGEVVSRVELCLVFGRMVVARWGNWWTRWRRRNTSCWSQVWF